MYIYEKAYLKNLAQVDNSLSLIKSKLSFFAGTSNGFERISILNYQKTNFDIIKSVVFKEFKCSSIESAYSNIQTEFFRNKKRRRSKPHCFCCVLISRESIPYS